MEFEVALAEEIWTAKYRFAPSGGDADEDFSATATRVAMAVAEAEAEARKLVVRGFFDDLIRKVTVPELAEKLSGQVEEELQRHVLKELV